MDMNVFAVESEKKAENKDIEREKRGFWLK